MSGPHVHAPRSFAAIQHCQGDGVSAQGKALVVFQGSSALLAGCGRRGVGRREREKIGWLGSLFM